MRKPEQKFYDWLRENNIFPGHHCRIENSVGVGQGDVNSCDHGVETWYELKVGKPEKLLDLLRDSQKIWHAKRVRQGGRIFVLVLYKDKIYVYKVIFRCIIKERYIHTATVDKSAPMKLMAYIHAN